jgi:hypothetical protein
MRAVLPILLCIACGQDLAVHIRVGDRPPTPEHLVVAGGVDVDEFLVVLRNLRLQSSPTDGGVSTPDEAIVGPGAYAVNLQGPQLTNGTFTPLIEGYHVGPKGYYEMDIDLAPVSQADVAGNALLAPLLGKTYMITGHDVHGVPFSFSGSPTQTMVRSYTFRMGMNHNNIDVNIAPNEWFVQPDGGPLDPFSTDPAVRSQIEANVVHSIDAYEDDDMNGDPDPLG